MLAWPGVEHLLFAARAGAGVALAFFVVYGGCDRLTAARSLRIPVHFAWELRYIPFWPGWAWAYNSILLLFALSSLALRRRAEYAALAWAMVTAIGAAGIGFLLVPAELAYPPIPPEAMTPMFVLADRMNMTYNLAPSLHVALSLICVGAYHGRARGWAQALLAAWGVAITASTLLTHQHHVVDVATGAALAWACLRWVYRPLAAG